VTTDLKAKAELFHSLHSAAHRPLILPNAWDAAGARIVEETGATAIATTSSGVAWSLGAADGNHADRDEVVRSVARMTAAVGVPVSADIEGGYAVDTDGVAETVRRVLAAGAVGINIEDSYAGGPHPLRPVADQASRRPPMRRAYHCSSTPASTPSSARPAASGTHWTVRRPISPPEPTASSSPVPPIRA
jgi:2-methylisocitrate lyase-like PEP mutase family enzyme